MRILLFEDELVRQLYPVSLGKPAFAINCGSYRLIDLVGELAGPIWAAVRPHLTEIVRFDFPVRQEKLGEGSGPLLAVNARLVPSASVIERLARFASAGQPGIVRHGGSIAALLAPPESLAAPLPDDDPLDPASLAGHLGKLDLPQRQVDLPLFEYPHDIVRHHGRALAENLPHRLARGNYVQMGDGVFLGPGATLGDYVVTDATRGPILLDAWSTAGPHAFLSGPLYLGEETRVLEHASLKDGVATGRTVKIGGEVEASIIESYTNKQHHGFLGHSYLGSWINLGAGTCNSDLKNTYGVVNMEYHGRKVSTGMQFVGTIVGDYAKTAINTGIFTGKTIGACSMVYGFVTTNVPSFVNYARLFGQATEAPVDVMVSTQRRMFERRRVAQRDCDIQLLRAMYTLTIHERQLAGKPLSLEPLSL